MEMAYYFSQMVANILENFMKMKLVDLGNIYGVMEKFIKDYGKIIK